MAVKSIGVGLVCVHYDPNKLVPTLRALRRIERVVNVGRTIHVANHKAAWSALKSTTVTADGLQVLLHDNSGMEFGAYQEGLDLLIRDYNPEWVLFANDTFATHHSFGQVSRRKLASELNRRDTSPVIIGRVDSLPRSFLIEGLRTHRWITTNLFALNRTAIDALSGRVYVDKLNARVTETGELEDFFSQQTDTFLRKHLEAWLFRAHPGWHWYASEPLSAANAPKMARKARSILQEKYLSAVLEDVGAEFVNLKELSLRDKLISKAEVKLFELIGRNF